MNSSISVGGGIDLSGSSGDNGGNASLTGSSISVLGDINLSGGEGANGGTANFIGQNGISLSGELVAQGGDATSGTAGSGGMVILSSSAGSLSIHNINTSGGAGTVAGASGGTAGIIALVPTNATGFDNTPTGTVIIGSDLSGGLGNLVAAGGTGISPGMSGAGALIMISANRSAPVSAATITSSLAGNDVTIDCRTFTMGQNEVLTVLGNLTVTATNRVTLGDTIALLDLTLTAPTINLETHGTYDILSSTGTLYPNTSLHFFAGQTLSVSGTLVPSGPIQEESFSTVYTTPEFRDLLIYNGSTILNFDTSTTPPPLHHQLLLLHRSHLPLLPL